MRHSLVESVGSNLAFGGESVMFALWLNSLRLAYYDIPLTILSRNSGFSLFSHMSVFVVGL